jgi:hypothetical protein
MKFRRRTGACAAELEGSYPRVGVTPDTPPRRDSLCGASLNPKATLNDDGCH